jgi:hypothetical protein
VAPAVLWWDNTRALALFLLLFGLTYTALYWRIVRFRATRWLFFPVSRVSQFSQSAGEDAAVDPAPKRRAP